MYACSTTPFHNVNSSSTTIASHHRRNYNRLMSAQPLITPDIEKEEDVEQETAKEPPYKVLIHNDDITPYDFVIVILVRIFELTPVIAEHITYLAHTYGIALVAVLPKSEAERRVGKAHFAARLEGFPLTFTLEPEE